MLRDDASPEDVERWYRRTPDEIEAEKHKRWNIQWAALRTPEHLARQADTMSAGQRTDRLRSADGSDRLTPVRQPVVAPAPPKTKPAAPPTRRDRIEAYETGPDGKLRFTPEYQRRADRNYEALMKAQDDLNYWTGWTGVPGLFNKATGPLGAMLGAAGIITSNLSHWATPPPGYKPTGAK